MTRQRTLLAGTAAVAIVAAAGIYWFGPHISSSTRASTSLPTVTAVLSEGEFVSLEHETTGVAAIVELEDGTRFLRIEELDTLSGPDLRVYLSQASASSPQDALDDAFVDLGGLKGNQGDQNYEIPSSVDLDAFESVAIWCRRFSVGLGVAPV